MKTTIDDKVKFAFLQRVRGKLATYGAALFLALSPAYVSGCGDEGDTYVYNNGEEENGNKNHSGNYTCGNWCEDISSCFSETTKCDPPEINNYNGCIDYCEQELIKMKKNLYDDGCISEDCQQEVTNTFYIMLKCMFEVGKRSGDMKEECRWVEEIFEEKTGFNW